jgi:UPF0716 protein FxsA
VLLIVLLVYLAAEIAAFVAVAQQIGVLLAVVLVLLVSACGPLLLRRVGLSVLDHARVRLEHGESPNRDLLDGVVVVLGGVLVCIPGFIGDAIGLVLLIGPVRHLVIRVAGRHLARQLDHDLVVRFRPRPEPPGHEPPGHDPSVIDAPTHQAPGAGGDRKTPH